MSERLLTEQSAEELTLEDINHPVQWLLQLVVFLHEALLGSVLVLLSVVKFVPILLEKLQGSLGIYINENKTWSSVTTSNESQLKGDTTGWETHFKEKTAVAPLSAEPMSEWNCPSKWPHWWLMRVYIYICIYIFVSQVIEPFCSDFIISVSRFLLRLRGSRHGAALLHIMQWHGSNKELAVWNVDWRLHSRIHWTPNSWLNRKQRQLDV